MRAFVPKLFEDIEWGNQHVIQQTKSKAKLLGLRVTEILPLSDIDHTEDLLVCRKQPAAFDNVLPKTEPGLLSVVIPTCNEERTLAATLRLLSRQEKVEVIVADCGSSDGTVDIARQFLANVIPCRKGRGQQMNAGAALSRGQALLFLHADTRPPDGFVERIWTILNQGAIAGSFKLGIAGKQSGLRWVESGANFRSRYFQMPYGDQGLYLLSNVFFEIGGYRHWPLMEDYDLCQRLRKRGQIAIAPESVTTSDRRWRELGVFRTTILNQFYITAFRLGVSPERLAKWYDAAKTKNPKKVAGKT